MDLDISWTPYTSPSSHGVDHMWLLVDAYLLIVGSSWIDEGAGTAWTVYPPLALSASHAGMSVEVFIISLHAVGASSLSGAINLMVTCTYARRVHTTLLQVSLYPWSVAYVPALVATMLRHASYGCY